MNTESLARPSTPLERAHAIAVLEAAEMALVQVRMTIAAIERGPRPWRGIRKARAAEVRARERRTLACWHALGIGVPPRAVEEALNRGAADAQTRN